MNGRRDILKRLLAAPVAAGALKNAGISSAAAMDKVQAINEVLPVSVPGLDSNPLDDALGPSWADGALGQVARSLRDRYSRVAGDAEVEAGLRGLDHMKSWSHSFKKYLVMRERDEMMRAFRILDAVDHADPVTRAAVWAILKGDD